MTKNDFWNWKCEKNETKRLRLPRRLHSVRYHLDFQAARRRSKWAQDDRKINSYLMWHWACREEWRYASEVLVNIWLATPKYLRR
jgi:hypothetical protein